MNKESLNPAELDQRLSQLGTRLALCAEDDREQVPDLCREFASWVGSTTGLPSFPTTLMAAQARQVLQGLSMGRPVEQVCQRLSQLMTEAVHHMGVLLAEPGPHTKTTGDTGLNRPLPPGTPLPDGAFFTIETDDLPGFRDFVAEAPDHLLAIESGLLSLVQGETWDPLKVYRPFHTLKGICGFMGLPGLAKLAHESEALLEKYKNHQGKPNEREVDLLLESEDLMKKQVGLVARGLSEKRFPLVDVEPLLARMAGGASAASTPMPVDSPSQPSAENLAVHHDHFLRINVEKMDGLMEMVGELAICQSQVTEGISAAGTLGHLASEASRLGKISRQLQEIVLSLRMVPVQPLFQRMSRLARDLSQKTGKPLKVELEGGETELDKRLTEELVDPLVHLIRNAVDHGIEALDKRLQAGKPAEARLRLKAEHQAGDFLLRVEDDGAGLSQEKLRRKAAALGLLATGEASPERLAELIFLPGFSTAEKVTEVSGRGVGLDAVKRKINALKGSVRVESREGQGTSFLLRIPLTMALIDGIIVRVASSRYVLPSFHVRQFMALTETESHRVSQSREWLDTPFGHIPVVELSEWFGAKAAQGNQAVVVHVQVGEKEACLVVDEVVGKQQVVVKGLGEQLQGMAGVVGGAILGDGKVGFILDLGALVQGVSRETSVVGRN